MHVERDRARVFAGLVDRARRSAPPPIAAITIATRTPIRARDLAGDAAGAAAGDASDSARDPLPKRSLGGSVTSVRDVAFASASASAIGGVMQRARKNYGYLYDSYPMIQAYTSHWDPGHPIHRVTEFLNSREFLDFGQIVTGAPVVTKADAQATPYTRGPFLDRHVDEGHDQEHVAAYTFGFTRNWQPDWGGLLMLIEEGMDVSRAFLPRFNMLSIFDGRRLHAVSPVSPFAGDARYQITGWFRNDPASGGSA